jgi:hypothetical protein
MIDLAGLSFSERKAKKERERTVRYYGFDIVKWRLVDDNLNEFNETKNTFYPQNIAAINYPKILADILMFPKSLSDFNDYDFSKFLEWLRSTEIVQNYIVTAASFIDESQDDKFRFEKILNVLQSKGFEKLPTETRSPSKPGWVNYFGGFLYPEEISTFLKDLSGKCPTAIANRNTCETDCEIKLDRNPILTTNLFKYQIARLLRR